MKTGDSLLDDGRPGVCTNDSLPIVGKETSHLFINEKKCYSFLFLYTFDKKKLSDCWSCTTFFFHLFLKN